MKKLIHYTDNSARLNCDNPVCRHQLPAGMTEWGPHLIGYPCPKCGRSMLSERDFIDHSKLRHRMKCLISVINFLFGWAFGHEEPPEHWDTMGVRVHNGQTEITERGGV